jgi:hypothetical protein
MARAIAIGQKSEFQKLNAIRYLKSGKHHPIFHYAITPIESFVAITSSPEKSRNEGE